MKKIKLVMAAAVSSTMWWYFYVPTPTTISVRIGDTFEQVEQASSYPVREWSDIPTYDEVGFGATWVKKPAVIIRFNDPQSGFSLPQTTFAAIGYMHNKVDTITTSPMLSKIPFDQAIAEVALLQTQFQAGKWQLDDRTTWFDLTPEGKTALHGDIRLGANGYGKYVSLRVPEKYSMFFSLRCAARCDSSIGLDRYLIDISIGQDFQFAIEKRRRQQEEP